MVQLAFGGAGLLEGPQGWVWFVLIVVVLLSPLVDHIPIPVLAVALVRIGWNIIDREQIRIAARSTGSDALVLAGTFVAALVLPLDAAIYTGVGLALFLALRKASTPTLAEYTFNTRVAKHLFCSECGVKAFYRPRSNPDGWSVNARCLDPSSLTRLDIKPFDGRNWEQAGDLAHLSAASS